MTPATPDPARAPVDPARVERLAARFPEARARDPHVAPLRGGRAAAEALLDRVDPVRYARGRNFLDGPVSRLSPYIRHGVLSLAEVRDRALDRARRPDDAAKFVNELAWRDYWLRVHDLVGDGVWRDREPSKTPGAPPTSRVLPPDVADAETGLACVDAFVRELRSDGYLHNHARMWFAAYLVHWRRVHWSAGAAFFLEHLLDGDPASNNLSWQWVAGTFSHKPYIFNRDNLARYSDNRLCAACPRALARDCPFDAPYETLEARLFPGGIRNPGSPPNANANANRDRRADDPADPEFDPEREPRYPLFDSRTDPSSPPSPPPLLWFHEDDLNPNSPMRRAHPEAPAAWVWDPAVVADPRAPHSFKRIVFVDECLAELPVEILDPVDAPAPDEPPDPVAAALVRAARARGANRIVTTPSPSPRFKALARLLRRAMAVQILPRDPFLRDDGPYDLARFSRYWRRAERRALAPTRSDPLR